MVYGGEDRQHQAIETLDHEARMSHLLRAHNLPQLAVQMTTTPAVTGLSSRLIWWARQAAEAVAIKWRTTHSSPKIALHVWQRTVDEPPCPPESVPKRYRHGMKGTGRENESRWHSGVQTYVGGGTPGEGAAVGMGSKGPEETE